MTLVPSMDLFASLFPDDILGRLYCADFDTGNLQQRSFSQGGKGGKKKSSVHNFSKYHIMKKNQFFKIGTAC